MLRRVASSNDLPERIWVPVTEEPVRRRERMFRRVVLPQPEGPIIARRLPEARVRVVFRVKRERMTTGRGI